MKQLLQLPSACMAVSQCKSILHLDSFVICTKGTALQCLSCFTHQFSKDVTRDSSGTSFERVKPSVLSIPCEQALKAFSHGVFFFLGTCTHAQTCVKASKSEFHCFNTHNAKTHVLCFECPYRKQCPSISLLEMSPNLIIQNACCSVFASCVQCETKYAGAAGLTRPYKFREGCAMALP